LGALRYSVKEAEKENLSSQKGANREDLEVENAIALGGGF